MRSPPPSTPTARGLAGRSAGGMALAAVGFAIVSVAFRCALPWPRAGALAAKLAVFEATRDEWDAVLIGSSRVVHGLIPDVVEQELERLGAPLRIFNLAADAMGSFEVDYVLRHVLSLEPARLTLALVELEAYEPLMPDHRRFRTARELHWHDLRQTLAVWRSIDLARIPEELKWAISLAHGRLFLERLLNIGRGRWWLGELLDEAPRSGEVDVDEIRRAQGFVAYDMTPGGELARTHRRFLQHLDEYRQAVATLADFQASPADLATYNVAALAAQLDLLAAHDVRAVHFLGPSSHTKGFVGALVQAGQLDGGDPLELLDFHKPRQHPELYAVERRFDADHLDLEGAQLFSRLFARELAPLVLGEELN